MLLSHEAQCVHCNCGVMRLFPAAPHACTLSGARAHALATPPLQVLSADPNEEHDADLSGSYSEGQEDEDSEFEDSFINDGTESESVYSSAESAGESD